MKLGYTYDGISMLLMNYTTRSSIEHLVGRPMGLTVNIPILQGPLRVNRKAEKDA